MLSYRSEGVLLGEVSLPFVLIIVSTNSLEEFTRLCDEDTYQRLKRTEIHPCRKEHVAPNPKLTLNPNLILNPNPNHNRNRNPNDVLTLT